MVLQQECRCLLLQFMKLNMLNCFIWQPFPSKFKWDTIKPLVGKVCLCVLQAFTFPSIFDLLSMWKCHNLTPHTKISSLHSWLHWIAIDCFNNRSGRCWLFLFVNLNMLNWFWWQPFPSIFEWDTKKPLFGKLTYASCIGTHWAGIPAIGLGGLDEVPRHQRRQLKVV